MKKIILSLHRFENKIKGSLGKISNLTKRNDSDER